MAYASDGSSSAFPTTVPDAAWQADQQNLLRQHIAALGDPTAAFVQGQVAKFKQYTSQLGSQLDQTAARAQQAAQGAATSATSGQPAAGDIAGWRQVILSQLPEQLRDNSELVNTILAGGYAESGLDPSRKQQGGNGVGFWQFDTGGGMGTGVPMDQLTSEPFQAARIIPQYIQAWQQAPAGLSPAEKASWVAAHAERPYDYQNPDSAARRNYANAYNRVAGDTSTPAAASPYQGTAGVDANQGAYRSASPAEPIPTSTGSSSPGQNPVAQFQAFTAALGNPVDTFLQNARQKAQTAAQGAEQAGQNIVSGAEDLAGQAGQSIGGAVSQVGQGLSNTLGTWGQDASNAATSAGQTAASVPSAVGNLAQSGLNTAANVGQGALTAINQAGQAYTNEADQFNRIIDPNYNPQAEQAREQAAGNGYQSMLNFQTQNIGSFPQMFQRAIADPILGTAYGAIEGAGQKLTGGAPRPFESTLPSDPLLAAETLGQRWRQGEDVSQLPANQQGFAGVAHTASDLLNPIWSHIPEPGLTVRSVIPNTVNAVNELIAPARNTPPQVQAALKDFAGRRLQAEVDAETLALRARGVLGADNGAAAAANFERTGEFLPNPNQAQQDFAAQVRQFMQQTGDQGRAAGYISGDVRTGQPGAPVAYFPHTYIDALNQAKGTAQRLGLNPRDTYSNSRVFPTLDEAIAAGKQPLDSVSAPLQHYAGNVLNSEAKAQLIADLKAAGPDAAMDYRPGDQLPPGWVPGDRLDRQFAPKPVSVLDAQGNPMTVYTNGVAFAPDVAKALKNILSPSAIRGTALGRAVLDAMGAAKESLFSLSGFHLLTEMRQAYRANGANGIPVIGKALWAAVNPASYERFRMANADLYSQASRAGVTGLAGEAAPDLGGNLQGLKGAAVRAVTGGGSSAASTYLISKQQGDDEQTAEQKAAVAGVVGGIAGPTVGKAISDSLFQRAVPVMKVLTWALARQSGADPEAAAAFTNNVYGGQGLTAIARGKTVQDVIRMAVLAPDWWESWANQLGGAVRGGDVGKLSRGYWLRTAAIDGAFILEGLNLALTGHTTIQNEPGHQTDLDLTPIYDAQGWNHTDQNGRPYHVYLDTLGPLKSIINAAGDPAGFAKNRLGLPLSEGVAAISNRDYRGRQIVQRGTPWPIGAVQQGAQALSQVAPVGAQQIGQAQGGGEPLPVSALSTLSGMRTSHSSTAATVQPTFTPSSQKILDQAGVKLTLGTVGDSIGGVPLRQGERDRYQTRTNQLVDNAIHKAANLPQWNTLSTAQKDEILKAMVRSAREQAQEEILTSIGPNEVKRRVTAKQAAAK